MDQQIPNRRQTLRSGDDLQPLPYISLPLLISLPPLLTLISIGFLSPPPPPPPCPVLSSSLPISLSSVPASSRQFQISAKAAARRLDAYCCHRNLPSALDYNVTLSSHQAAMSARFMSDQIRACLSGSVSRSDDDAAPPAAGSFNVATHLKIKMSSQRNGTDSHLMEQYMTKNTWYIPRAAYHQD